MTQIGLFSATAEGFQGQLRTLCLDVQISIVAAEPSESENAPDYRIFLSDDTSGPEIGAGWKRTGEKAGAYVAVQIDDPVWPHPLRANLFRAVGDDVGHVLLWNRPVRRDDRS